MIYPNGPRSEGARYYGDYSGRWRGPGEWDRAGKPFDAGDVDARHDFESWDVPSWDTSAEAQGARSFALWKTLHPDRYAEIQNLYGDAEWWYEQNWAEEEQRFPTYVGRGIPRVRKPKGKFETALDNLHAKYTGFGWNLMIWCFVGCLILMGAAAIGYIFIASFVATSVLNIIFGTASLILVFGLVIGVAWTVLEFLYRLAQHSRLVHTLLFGSWRYLLITEPFKRTAEWFQNLMPGQN